ncbi:MAG: hypothetical protein MSG64_07450 [Pyrinomonadaceae bacterium MAG19_C2-C3]|nr:hypothetical protein [Pyrinomonadaceae bacterium MAG19_C2-C3]
MAQLAQHQSTVNSLLSYVMEQWRSVPEMARVWDKLSSEEQMVYEQGWTIVDDRVRELDALKSQGALDGKQLERYGKLQQAIRQHEEKLNRLFAN